MEKRWGSPIGIETEITGWMTDIHFPVGAVMGI
jgi:hypothetical protein